MARKEKKHVQESSCAVCGQSFKSEREQREHDENGHQDQSMRRPESMGESHDDSGQNQPNR